MKRFFAVILASVLLCSASFPAFAGRVSTSSDASRPYRLTAEPWKGVNPDSLNLYNFASASNALYADVVPFSVADDLLPFASVYTNGKWDYDVRGTFYKSYSSGIHYTWPNLPSGSQYRAIFFILSKSDGELPRPGTYGFKFQLNQGDIGLTFSSGSLRVCQAPENVTPKNYYATAGMSPGYNPVLTGNVVIDYSTREVVPSFFFQGISSLDIVVPNASAQFTLDKQEGGTAEPEYIPGTGNEVADNTGQLVEQQEQTNNFLIQIIQTISNQLAAFWNQLAGEFTNLYNMMDSQHNEQLDNDNANAELIVDSANENTNTITNGFDNSQMESNSDILEDSLNQMDSAESEVIDSVSGNLKDFEFPSIDLLPRGVLAALLFFGNQMQYWFEGMGHMNFPITLSLTLIFALMLVGYHRFRN